MKAFLAALAALIVITIGADVVLNEGLGFSAREVFSVDGVRPPE